MAMFQQQFEKRSPNRSRSLAYNATDFSDGLLHNRSYLADGTVLSASLRIQDFYS